MLKDFPRSNPASEDLELRIVFVGCFFLHFPFLGERIMAKKAKKAGKRTAKKAAKKGKSSKK